MRSYHKQVEYSAHEGHICHQINHEVPFPYIAHSLLLYLPATQYMHFLTNTIVACLFIVKIALLWFMRMDMYGSAIMRSGVLHRHTHTLTISNCQQKDMF